MVIDGANFAPGVTVELRQGSDSLLLTDNRYLSREQVEAVVPVGVTPGLYDIVMRNPEVEEVGRLDGAYSALSALDDQVYVNADDLWIDTGSSLPGGSVRLGLDLHRQGGKTTVVVPVRFYLGDPDSGGTVVGEVDSEPLSPWSETQSVYLELPMSAIEGAANVVAVIDPENTLPEVTKERNMASRSLAIMPAALDAIPPGDAKTAKRWYGIPI